MSCRLMVITILISLMRLKIEVNFVRTIIYSGRTAPLSVNNSKKNRIVLLWLKSLNLYRTVIVSCHLSSVQVIKLSDNILYLNKRNKL